MKVLVTGGLGFIGSAVVRKLFRDTACDIMVIDAYTYAANPKALEDALHSPRVTLEKCDIRIAQDLKVHFEKFQPDYVLHLAAESHVDRSLNAPVDFMTTNVIGTFELLNVALNYFESLQGPRRERFRFLHVSTDEVYGSLDLGDKPFNEATPYDPRSPYSASKAASDHLVSAWYHSYGLPTIISNCSNNYGPWQNSEKLIPLIISNAFFKKPLPVYGDGKNRRDWLYVDDHANALLQLLHQGKEGKCYTIGGGSERSNLDVVNTICKIMDDRMPNRRPHQNLIRFVKDRPGHDFRYAIDASNIRSDLNWKPLIGFYQGLEETVDWYLKVLKKSI